MHATEKMLVTFGIVPGFPEKGFGHIAMDEPMVRRLAGLQGSDGCEGVMAAKMLRADLKNAMCDQTARQQGYTAHDYCKY